MANNYFRFKQFTIFQDKCVFKVGTDGVLLGAYADITGARSVLDIGTGTGLIALMLAQRCEADIVAIEPDPGSFYQACENIEKSRWSNRIKVHMTNVQDFRPDDIRFNLIVSNPPYFADSLMNPDSEKAAARHHVTLNNGELLEGVSRLLAGNGRFQVIMPYAEGNIFIAEATEYGLYCNHIFKIKSLPRSDIRRLIMTFSKQRQKITEKFLTIEHGKRHDFTDEYINLTRDFYLNF